MSNLIYKDLKETLFSFANKDTDLLVISGYVSPNVILELSQKYNNVNVIYGMYGIEGINSALHSSLVSLNKMKNINVYYSLYGTHSKAYILIKNNDIKKVLIGSANLSENGLNRQEYQEILMDIDTFDKNQIIEFIYNIYNSSKNCNEITPIIKNTNHKKTYPNTLCAIMPLYLVDAKTKKKYVPLGSGLNWGNQNGHIAKNENAAMESYIKISSDHIDNYPLLFPPISLSRQNTDGKITRKNDSIEIISDDGFIMTCLFSGKGVTRNNRDYPKQITSTGDGGNSKLGEYIRNRMNVPKRHVITYEDLQKYGRDNIKLTYIQEGLYSADFSTKKQ